MYSQGKNNLKKEYLFPSPRLIYFKVNLQESIIKIPDLCFLVNIAEIKNTK